jgi:hypothetical protein
MFLVLDEVLTFYQGVVRSTATNQSHAKDVIEGSCVEICLKARDCFAIDVQRFEPPWQFGILLQVATGTIRLASPNEMERDEWFLVISNFLAFHQPPIEKPLSPSLYDNSATPVLSAILGINSPTTRYSSYSPMPATTAGEIVRDLARDALTSTQSMPSRIKTSTGRLLVQVDDSITFKKVPKRHRTAVSSSPMSHWTEEGLDSRKQKWTDDVARLRARGDDEFTADEALHTGVSFKRGSLLVDALSKSAHVEDFRNLEGRMAMCSAIERELEEVNSQVEKMQKDLEESPMDSQRSTHHLLEAMPTEMSSWADSTVPQRRTPSRFSRLASDDAHLSVEEAFCRDMVAIFPRRWIDSAALEVGGKLKWRTLSNSQQLSAVSS